MSDVTVEHCPDSKRYEAMLDGEVAGYISYELGDGVIDLQHTIVDDKFGGRGVGGALASGTINQIRDQGDLKIIPTCPFIKKWFARHPDYAGLLAS